MTDYRADENDRQSEIRQDRLADEEDTCRVVEVDGEPIRARGSGDWTDEDKWAFVELIKAARRRMAAEQAIAEAKGEEWPPRSKKWRQERYADQRPGGHRIDDEGDQNR